MQTPSELFENECRGDTILVAARNDLSEFRYETLETEAADVIELLKDPGYRNLVIDLTDSNYCASSALGLFLRLWKMIRGRGGGMAVCGVSEEERIVLRTMKLDTLWAICEDRDEALAAVQKGNTGRPGD